MGRVRGSHRCPCRRARRRLAGALAVAAPILLGAAVARAVDPFEIQVYDAAVPAPGSPGLEIHLNSVIEGRRDAEPPELPLHHQSHFTAEGSIGITRWWDAGAYLQTALLGD